MGELKAGQTDNFDHEIMPFISSCNVACGFHSGTPLVIENTIKSALANGVSIGAHPSYNDAENFGRLSIEVAPAVLAAEWRYQICAVKGIVESFGHRLKHVKPHGALYNDLARDPELSDLFVRLVKDIDPKLKIFTLAHSGTVDACIQHGMQYVNEGFADRRYEQLDRLRSRQLDHAVLHEPKDVLRQIEQFLRGRVQLYTGEICSINVKTVCLHSDTEGAVALSRQIHHYLKENHVEIAALA